MHCASPLFNLPLKCLIDREVATHTIYLFWVLFLAEEKKKMEGKWHISQPISTAEIRNRLFTEMKVLWLPSTSKSQSLLESENNPLSPCQNEKWELREMPAGSCWKQSLWNAVKWQGKHSGSPFSSWHWAMLSLWTRHIRHNFPGNREQ